MQEDTPHTSNATGASRQHGGGGARVGDLCVDDEPSILSSLRRLFRPKGYQIYIAEGGKAALVSAGADCG